MQQSTQRTTELGISARPSVPVKGVGAPKLEQRQRNNKIAPRVGRGGGSTWVISTNRSMTHQHHHTHTRHTHRSYPALTIHAPKCAGCLARSASTSSLTRCSQPPADDYHTLACSVGELTDLPCSDTVGCIRPNVWPHAVAMLAWPGMAFAWVGCARRLWRKARQMVCLAMLHTPETSRLTTSSGA